MSEVPTIAAVNILGRIAGKVAEFDATAGAPSRNAVGLAMAGAAT